MLRTNIGRFQFRHGGECDPVSSLFVFRVPMVGVYEHQAQRVLTLRSELHIMFIYLAGIYIEGLLGYKY